MIPPILEEQVNALEDTAAQLLSQSAIAAGKKDWRSTLGMFADDPVRREIDAAGRHIREAERQQTPS